MTAPAFDALLVAQDLDTKLDQLRHRRATLPGRAELAQLAADRERLDAQLTDARRARDEVVAAQVVLETDLAVAEKRAADVSKRLYSGEVSASRELQAMAADVEAQRGRASDLEDQILAVLDVREPLDATVDALEEELTAGATRRDAVMASLGDDEAAVDAEMSLVHGERAAAAAVVPPDLFHLYDRLRERLGGVGAARLIGARCGGCHLSLSATEIDRIRHVPDDALVTCDHCERILVRP